MLSLKQTSMFFVFLGPQFLVMIRAHGTTCRIHLARPIHCEHCRTSWKPTWSKINLVFRYVFDMLSYFKPRVNNWSFLAWHQKSIELQRCHDVNVRVHSLLDAVLDKASNLRFPRGHFSRPCQDRGNNICHYWRMQWLQISFRCLQQLSQTCIYYV